MPCLFYLPHLQPSRRGGVLPRPGGEIAIAPRADRGVRPYRTLCGFADGLCNFAIAFCRGERGIDLYGDFCMAAVRCAFLVVRPAREGQSLSPTQIWSLIAKALYLKTYSPSPHPSAFGCHLPHTGKAFFCAPRKKIRRQLPPDFFMFPFPAPAGRSAPARPAHSKPPLRIPAAPRSKCGSPPRWCAPCAYKSSCNPA